MPYFMGFQHEISISGQPQFASPQGMVNFPKATGDITKISVLNDDLRTLNFTSRIGYGIGFYLRLGYRYQNAKRRLASLLGREPKKSA